MAGDISQALSWLGTTRKNAHWVQKGFEHLARVMPDGSIPCSSSRGFPCSTDIGNIWPSKPWSPPCWGITEDLGRAHGKMAESGLKRSPGKRVCVMHRGFESLSFRNKESLYDFHQEERARWFATSLESWARFTPDGSTPCSSSETTLDTEWLLCYNRYMKWRKLKPLDNDLKNIRDEILGSVNQSLYLFTLKQLFSRQIKIANNKVKYHYKYTLYSQKNIRRCSCRRKHLLNCLINRR